MKKIITGALAVAALTTGSIAGDSFFDYKQELGLGLTMIDVRANGIDTSYGLNINGKLMKSVSEEIALGMTINMDYNPSVKVTNQSSNPKEYFIDLLTTVTYIVNKDVDVSAMFGYEFGKYDADWGKWDTEGWTYGLSASYAINEQLRINIQALRTNMDYTRHGDKDNESMNRFTLGVGYNF
jgi:hypothetical protein